MSPVKAPPFDPLLLSRRLEEAGAQKGFRCETFGRVGGGPLIALTKHAKRLGPRIYLSGGIHGDEPAPPLALLSLLDSGALSDRASWFLCPLLNPDGFVRGTRENAAGLDLNRDYRHLESEEIRAHAAWLNGQPNFDLAIAVHEDWESSGFYLYELNPDGRPGAAQAMIDEVAKVCPIDHSPVIEGRDAVGGIIRPLLNPAEREKWPESIYLQAHHTRLSYTIESPSALPIATRVSGLIAALTTAIGLVIGGKA